MNISKEQKYSLKAWLDKQLKYREVFDEVYDHVLSALETAPEGTDFEAAYHLYINNEFGGEAGLHLLERRHRREIFNAMRQRYFNYMKQQLRYPAVLMWALLALTVYLTFSASWFDSNWGFGVYLCLSAAPVVISLSRYLKTGYLLGNTKRSVADDVFRWLKYFQQMTLTVLLMMWVFFGDNLIAAFSRATPLILTVFIVGYLLHIVSVFKLYRYEFKVILAR